MSFDIVLPYENENFFLNVGFTLGYDSLIFLYSLEYYLKNKDRLFFEDNRYKKISVGVYGDFKSVLKLKNVLKFVDVSFTDIRKIIENSNVDFIYGLGKGKKKYTHVRNSGLNQVYSKLLVEKDIFVAQNLKDLNYSNFDLWENIIQNFFLSKKFGFKMNFFSFASNSYEMVDVHDLNCFLELFY